MMPGECRGPIVHRQYRSTRERSPAVRRAALLFVLICSGACTPPDFEEYRIGTAALGGAYYPLGQSIANVVTQYADGVAMVPIVTRGAVENPRLVAAGDLELGITNADLAFFAYRGQAPYQQPLELLSAGALHPSVLHLVTSEATGIVDYAELRGRRLAVGPAGGTTVGLVELLLNAHGMTLQDVVPSFLSYSDGFSQLSDGNVDAAFALAGYPAAAVLQASASQDLRFLRIAPEILDAVIAENPYYRLAQIPADVYDTSVEVTALAVDNMLVVNSSAAAADVFIVVSAIYDHLDELRRANAVARQIAPEQSTSLAVPLHPGAAQYFSVGTPP